MTLRTVCVPPALGPLFEKAEELVSRYFATQRSDAARGTIEIQGERYILVRGAALSVEFFALVEGLYGPGREEEAEAFAQSILFDLAHAVGKADARSFHAKMGLVDPIERMSAGPVHFAHTGWAKVDISPESTPVLGEECYFLYDHPSSFESDAWARSGKRRQRPACIMNAGYSSGWCEESFGLPLVAVEVLCRARGDEACRFIMAPPSRIEARVARFHAEGPPHAAPAIPDFFSRQKAEEDLKRRVEERTAELERSNQRLRREIEERERAEARLLQTFKLEAIGRLAGGIAHDFNNLMAILSVNCDLLLRRLDEADPSRGFVEDIAAAGARAAALTQQLLAFSRAQPAQRTRLDLNRVVGELGRMLERVLGEDIVLVTHFAEALGAIDADRGQIEQVVMNLVVNARDAMPRGGTLAIETGEVDLDAARVAALGSDLAPGRHVTLAVRDNGTGIPPEAIARIFDPFFTTKEVGEGTGLGLATVYGIVRQSGGAIAVESTVGQGTCFTIYLPRAGAGSSVPAPSRPTPAPPTPPPTIPTTILVVEDQERLREVIGHVLKSFGYDALLARDAADALRIAQDHAEPIHLLLTDVVMPRTSGPLLAERIRVLRPDTKVVFMSGYAPEAMTPHGALADAALLQKPFGPDALDEAVRHALGRS